MAQQNIGIIQDLQERGAYLENRLIKLLSSELEQVFPFNNSANRKMMWDAQRDQRIGLKNPQPPMLASGFDLTIGEYNSSFIRSDYDIDILNKIVKYESLQKKEYQDYVLIVYNKTLNMYDIITRDTFHYNTEIYGYLWNNEFLDSLKVGSNINKGEVVKKSTNYDKYDNRMDGTNLLIAFMSPLETSEDAILVSKSASKKKLESPFFDVFEILLNDNDIPLNMFGDANNYKSFPDIGEYVNGAIMVTRRENKDDILYTHAYPMLSNTLPSDTTYYSKGLIINIDVFSNNPDLLASNQYYSQLSNYYNESIEYSRKIVQTLRPLIEDPDAESTTALKSFYELHKGVMNSKEWLNNNKPFSNTIIRFSVINDSIMGVGDKLTNRHGGKGVVSEVLPDELMPRYNGRTLDAVLDLGGVVGRKNVGQLFEVELNNVSDLLLNEYKVTGDYETFLKRTFTYLKYVDIEYSKYIKRLIFKEGSKFKKAFVDSMVSDGGIFKVCNPTNIMTIDLFADLLRELDIHPRDLGEHLMTPIEGSDGRIRYVPSLNKFYPGYMYMYRLKQVAEHKFSSTTLSATNIKGLPVPAKLNKKGHKIPYSSTPIQFGEMEAAEYEHIGSVLTVLNLMTYSTSPIARRACEELLTGNPYDISIDVPEDARSRTVEIINVFFKTIGLKLVFERIEKRGIRPIFRNTINRPKNYVYQGDYQTPMRRGVFITPIIRMPVSPIQRLGNDPRRNTHRIRLIKMEEGREEE